MTEILVIKPSSVGDILHGLQVAQSIKDQAPDSRITWVVRDRFAPLVETCATVDEVLYFRRGRGPRAFLALLREIRARRYDTVLDFQGLARTGVMTMAARATHKIGRGDAREGAGLFYRQRAPLPPWAQVPTPIEGTETPVRPNLTSCIVRNSISLFLQT